MGKGILFLLFIELTYGGICKMVRPGLYIFTFDYPYPGEETRTVYFGSKDELARWVYKQLAPFAPPEKPSFIKRILGFLTGGLIFKTPTYSDTMSLKLKLNPQLAAQRALDLWSAIEVIPPDKKTHKGFINVLFTADKIDTLPILYKELIKKRKSYLLWLVLQDVSMECLRLARISYKEYENLCRSKTFNLQTVRERWERIEKAKKMAQLALLLYTHNEEAKSFLKEIGVKTIERY